jgi:hypothetical protein
MPEFHQPVAQHRFGQELWQHQRYPIGLVERRLADLLERRFLEAIATMHALRRIGTTQRDESVNDAEVLEHLQAARLDALATRAAKRLRGTVDQAERDTAPAKLDGQGQAGRSGAANQNVRRENLHQHDLRLCV